MYWPFIPAMWSATSCSISVAGEANRSGGVATQQTQGRQYHRHAGSGVFYGSTPKHPLVYLAIACVKQAHQARRQQNYLSAMKSATFLSHFKRDLTEEEQRERDDEATKVSFEDDVLAVLEVEVASRTDCQKKLVEGYDWLRTKRWPTAINLDKNRTKDARRLGGLTKYKNEKGDDIFNSLRSIWQCCFQNHLRDQAETARAFAIKDNDFSVHFE